VDINENEEKKSKESLGKEHFLERLSVFLHLFATSIRKQKQPPEFKMRLTTFATALLLPFALAQDSTTTTTITSYTTFTKTITLTPSSVGYNATSTFMPTGSMTTKPIATQGVSGGQSLQAAQYALAGVAGMLVVALM